MNRNELKDFIAEKYKIDADCPWLRYPNYEVFRHGGNRKWFAPRPCEPQRIPS